MMLEKLELTSIGSQFTTRLDLVEFYFVQNISDALVRDGERENHNMEHVPNSKGVTYSLNYILRLGDLNKEKTEIEKEIRGE